MTSPSEEISQELDDLLLNELDEVESQSSDDADPTLTPGQAVYDDRQSKIVDEKITQVGRELDVSETTQRTAKSLFKQYVDAGDITGNAIEVLSVASLYAACKIESVPLSPDDFAGAQNAAVTRVLLLRRVKTIASTLGLNPQSFFDPSQYVDRYCDELGLDDEVTKRAHEIITISDNAGIGVGKSPTGRAAAAVYNAGLEFDRKVTQTEVATTADVSEVTIRNRYQDQREILE